MHNHHAEIATHMVRCALMKKLQRGPGEQVVSRSVDAFVFTPLTLRGRPSHSRISHLEQENRRLQASLGRLRYQDPSGGEENVSRVGRTPHSNDESISPSTRLSNTASPEEPKPDDDSSPAVSRMLISPEGEASYHGPTSTLFDDAAGDRRGLGGTPAIPKMSPAWAQKGLMADAAYQRTGPIFLLLLTAPLHERARPPITSCYIW